ncbi:MAG: hypothetical protein HY649_01540 [Acidobacteria bacterium]|nr:hypothetical protein [Acidobacteriota bacterium]
MKIHPIKPLLLAAMAAAILYPVTVQAEEQESAPRVVATTPHATLVAENYIPSRVKRVWTNDDFPARELAAPSDALAEAPAPTGNPETAEESEELQNAEKEVIEEMLVTARNRQKAYEETIGIIEGRLQSETSQFRIEAYQRILEDTRSLQKVNEQTIQRFEALTANGEGQPALAQQ